MKLSWHLKCKLCAGNSIHFRHTNRGSFASVKVFETENVSTWRGLEPPTFGFMPNAPTYWAFRGRHLLSHVFEYWLWWCRYFWSKASIWDVNCERATAFIFGTRTCVLVQVSKFWWQKMFRPEGDSNPQISDGFMPNYLTYWAIRARHLLSHVFEYWLWRCRYFWSKVSIWNVNCARATAFIVDTQTGVLVQMSQSFWDRKCVSVGMCYVICQIRVRRRWVYIYVLYSKQETIVDEYVCSLYQASF